MSETQLASETVDLVVLERNGFIESRHRGTAVVINAAGEITFALGNPNTLIFPRSTLKPFQAMASMQLGVPLRGAQVALACASHVGSTEHTDVVESMLAAAGLSSADLRCPEAWPAHEATRSELIRQGGGKSKIAFNCSGKHAAFLWACTENGWDTENYLSADHPVQQRVISVIEEYAGEKISHLGVDGCGAPVPVISLAGLARAVSKLALAPGNKHADARAATIATAMLDYPWAVQGHGLPNSVVMEDLEVIAKLGAEGVLVMAAPNGTAVAVKMLDGSGRGSDLLGLTLLANAGAITTAQLESVLPKLTRPVLGGEVPVGSVRLASHVINQLES
ncbi:MAG: asparaginase [Paeniglutamicibacter terrestris]|jgi:L-asparaginase II|uniref:Asparaginase n=1 Tax=Paeniglutamicibacter terrestris TaxID=2723403 RepID=A0ABX1FZ56_9MICC|nr:asparaginase [Paeniglutamicibacter terrestris]ASN38517.1 asparaginase [Arthrobacter sp. 7749]NKG19228.1 asparaginase [Paeniglutamicibacter terrestris]